MTTNTFITNAEVSNEGLRVLSNWIKFTKNMKNSYSDKFGVEGNKIGDTYNLRKPAQYKQTTGSSFQAQGINETVVPIVLNNWVTRGLQMSTQDLTLSIDMFSSRIILPVAKSAANQIDQYNLEQALACVYNVVGTPGTAPTSQQAFNQLVVDADVTLAMNLAQDEMHQLMATPAFAGLGAVLNTNVFNNQARVGEANVKGYITNTMGFDWYRTQIMPDHTNGTFSGAGAVSGAGQSGSTLVTNTWGSGTFFTKGTRFTIAGVHQVNPQTKQVYANLQQFVVTATTAPGTTQTLTISPAITVDPQLQNVDALPADTALITVVGTTGQTYHQSLGFDEDAFGYAFADLAMPAAGMGVLSSKSSDSDLGINLQYTRGYDIRDFSEIHRLDTLQGFVGQYPQLAVALAM